MDTTDTKPEALFALITDEQRRRLQDTAAGKGWAAGSVFDILMWAFLFLLMDLALTSGGGERQLRTIAFAAAFAVICAYISGIVRTQRRVQALLRLFELGQRSSVDLSL